MKQPNFTKKKPKTNFVLATTALIFPPSFYFTRYTIRHWNVIGNISHFLADECKNGKL
jgi:hypothetical protein